MSENETEQVDFSELVVGDVILSQGRLQQGKIIEITPEFREVTLEDGSKPGLEARVTRLKRS